MIYYNYTNKPLLCFCYYFWAKTPLRDPESDPKRILTEDDIRIQMYFNLKAVREDLRKLDNPYFSDIPDEENAAELVAEILCYDGEDMYINIKDFSELFFGLEGHYSESLKKIKENLNSNIEYHNQMNKNEDSWYKDRWSSEYSTSVGEKLYVPKTDITPRIIKKIKMFLDPNVITV